MLASRQENYTKVTHWLTLTTKPCSKKQEIEYLLGAFVNGFNARGIRLAGVEFINVGALVYFHDKIYNQYSNASRLFIFDRKEFFVKAS